MLPPVDVSIVQPRTVGSPCIALAKTTSSAGCSSMKSISKATVLAPAALSLSSSVAYNVRGNGKLSFLYDRSSIVMMPMLGFALWSYSGSPNPNFAELSSKLTCATSSAIRLMKGRVPSGNSCSVSPIALATRPNTRAMISARTLGLMVATLPNGLTAAADIPSVASVDTDDVAAFDEEGDLHCRAGLEFGRLGRVGGGVALEAGVGLDDLELDVGGQVHADRDAVVELHVDHHAVLEEVGRVADEFALDRNVLERLLIHEVVAVGVVVEHLHLPIVDGCSLELFAGAERTLQGRTVLDVLEAGADERGTLARLDVQELDDGPEVAVHDDGHAITEIVARNHDRPEYGPGVGKPCPYAFRFKSSMGPSVPARRRAMFSRWRQTTISAATAP